MCQMLRQFPDVFSDVEFGQTFGLVNKLVGKSHRPYSDLRVDEHGAEIIVVGMPRLKAEKAMDHSKVVLHPVMDLAQKNFFFAESSSYLLFSSLSVRDIVPDAQEVVVGGERHGSHLHQEIPELAILGLELCLEGIPAEVLYQPCVIGDVVSGLDGIQVLQPEI